MAKKSPYVVITDLKSAVRVLSAVYGDLITQQEAEEELEIENPDLDDILDTIGVNLAMLDGYESRYKAGKMSELQWHEYEAHKKTVIDGANKAKVYLYRDQVWDLVMVGDGA